MSTSEIHRTRTDDEHESIAPGDRALGSGVQHFLERYAADLVGELADWVRIPSIAGTDDGPQRLEESAQWLARRFRATGFPTVEILPTGDSFAVYAEWCPDPTAPTYLVYSHHDVRSALEPSWHETDAFSPMLRDGRLFGRGASDAKGQVLAHLWAVRAHLAATGRRLPAVNLKFLIEGEEEISSPHLEGLLRENAERFAADVVVFSDTLQWSTEHPALCTSVRGMVSATIEVRGPEHDVHSGAVSGSAPNPILELAALLGELHDDDGRIALPHFYDDVEEPTAERRDELAALPYDEERWLQESATRRVGGESGFTVLERLWVRPSIEVTTVSGGDTIDPPRAVIPAVATASVSIRTVPGQTAATVAQQLRDFVAERLDESICTVDVAEETAQEPYITPAHPARDALARAMAVGHRVDRVGRMGNAGGGPAELLARLIDAPVLFYGTGLAQDNWHEGDESVDVELLRCGAATMAVFWSLARTAESP